MPYQAVHFGAGNIGRGFLGQLYRENDYEITFLDFHNDTIDRLQAATSYKIFKVDANTRDVKSVSKFRALHHKKDPRKAIEAIAKADIFTCSVGPRRLKMVGPILEKAINMRDPKLYPQPLAVIACENDQNATDHLCKYINLQGEDWEIAQKVEFANCAIDRIVPNQHAGNGLDVTIEKYFDWTVETGPFKGRRPQIKGIKWVEDLGPYLERKLFTVNTGHASIAYLGWAAGFENIHEALADRRIRDAVQRILNQTSQYLLKNYEGHFSAKEQQDYVRETIQRFTNPALNDSCIRVARDPMRKLSSKERLTKPAGWLAERKLPFDALLAPMEQAFRFQGIPDDDTSEVLADVMCSRSPEDAVNFVTKLTAKNPLFVELVKIVKRVQADPPNNGRSSGPYQGGPVSALPQKFSNQPGNSRGGMSRNNQKGISTGPQPRQLGGSIGRSPGPQPQRPVTRASHQGRQQALPVRKPPGTLRPQAGQRGSRSPSRSGSGSFVPGRM